MAFSNGQKLGGGITVVAAIAAVLASMASIPATYRSAMGLGSASVEDVGTANGDIPQLVDVGGSPGLPAVSGANLTAVTAADTALVDGTAAATVKAGAALGATAVQPSAISPSGRIAYLSDDDLSSALGTDDAKNGTISQETGYKRFQISAVQAAQWTHNIRTAPQRYYTLPDGDFFAYMLVENNHAQADYSSVILGLTSSTSGLENYWVFAATGRSVASAGYDFLLRDNGGGASTVGSFTTFANDYRWIGIARLGNVVYQMDSANATGDEPGPNDWTTAANQTCAPGGGYFAGMYDRLLIAVSDEGTAAVIDVHVSKVRIFRR
jgi:hypothetical protein